jgi:outer membrane lipoprotein-sorting protein
LRVPLISRSIWCALVMAGVLWAMAPARAETDNELLGRVESYLNAIVGMQANFMQVNHDGTISEGTLVLQRPGLMRLDYQPPVMVRIVSDGEWITYYDLELGQISQAPLNGTHAELLVRNDLRFGEDFKVMALKHEAATIEITLARGGDATEGTLTLIFSDNPIELRQWSVIDTQGLNTQVTLFDTRFGVTFDPVIFETPAPFPESDR